MRVMTLNLAHGRNRAPHQALVNRRTLDGNLERIGSAIERAEPDLVALQEADGPSTWSGDIDHVERIREHAKIPHAYRGDHARIRTRRFHASYGTAVLSKHPFRDTECVRFLQSWRDDKGFVRAVVDAPELPGLEVISVHLDYIRPAMRRKQARRMIEALGPSKNPRIVMGDFNTGFRGTDRCVISMLSAGLGLSVWKPIGGPRSFPSFLPAVRLDWILVSPHLRFREYRMLPDKVSDHLGVIADIEPA